ncbi:MAG: serine/threonine-protein kinase [Acidobacteriota bacterium]
MPAESLGAIAHYNLLERLGVSVLGPIYRARDTKVGRTVALRLVPDASFSDSTARELFLKDARVAMALSHPNIAALFDAAEYEGGCYLAYEFASGVTLRQESGGRPVNPRRAVELAAQVAEALAEGHSRDVLHGDLRPDTVFVTQKGSAKVLDFGMSRWTRGGAIRLGASSAPESLGADTVPVVSYMSPEQALGAGFDHRADVFSLGVVLYEMLTGRNPFAGGSVAATLVNITSAALPPLPVAGAFPDLSAIVLKATAKEVDRRYQSAVTFSAELRSAGAILDVRSGDAPPFNGLPLDEERGSGKWWAAAAAGAAAVAAIVWWSTR